MVGLDLADPGDELPRQTRACRSLGGVELQQQWRNVGDRILRNVEQGVTLAADALTVPAARAASSNRAARGEE